MKLALLIALSADKRTGMPLGKVAPFDVTLAEWKHKVAAGVAPTDTLTVLEVWGTGGVAKTHRFKDTPTSVKAAAKAEADAKAKAEADAKAEAAAKAKAEPVKAKAK